MERDHIEILLEDIRGKVEMIAEGYDMLNRKIDRVEINLSEKITANGQRIAANGQQIAANSEKLTDLQQQVAQNSRQIAANSEQLAANSEQLAANSEQLAANSDKLAVHSDKLTANSDKIDRLAFDLAEMRRELNRKIDRVADGLEAHRNDTERHRGYMVAEH